MNTDPIFNVVSKEAAAAVAQPQSTNASTAAAAMRPFKVLGIQQIAIGGTDKERMKTLWVDMLGLTQTGDLHVVTAESAGDRGFARAFAHEIESVVADAGDRVVFRDGCPQCMQPR